jgi:hypothetical protein
MRTPILISILFFSGSAGFLTPPLISNHNFNMMRCSKANHVSLYGQRHPVPRLRRSFGSISMVNNLADDSDPTTDGMISIGDKAVGENQEVGALTGTELEPTGTFRERFGQCIPDWLSERLEQGGFSVPTSVQAEAIETVVVQGRDALVQAYTGGLNSI